METKLNFWEQEMSKLWNKTDSNFASELHKVEDFLEKSKSKEKQQIEEFRSKVEGHTQVEL